MKQNFGTQYLRRSWLRPLLIGFGIIACVFLVAFVTALVATPQTGPSGPIV